VVEERAHTASAAALAEATERLASLAATPPLPDHAVWAERAAELERGALDSFDGRALAGAAAAAARHALAESVRREASQQLEALLRISRQVCEDAAVLAGAAEMAEPTAAAAEGYVPAEMLGGLVRAYEDEAQGPARYEGLRSLLTSQLAPWLAQVAGAQAAARDQVAAAARAEHDGEREARRDAELGLATARGEVATKAEAIARLEAGALALTLTLILTLPNPNPPLTLTLTRCAGADAARRRAGGAAAAGAAGAARGAGGEHRHPYPYP